MSPPVALPDSDGPSPSLLYGFSTDATLWHAAGQLAGHVIRPESLAATPAHIQAAQGIPRALRFRLDHAARSLPSGMELHDYVEQLFYEARTAFLQCSPSSGCFFTVWAFQTSIRADALDTEAVSFQRPMQVMSPFPDDEEMSSRLLVLGEAFGVSQSVVMLAFGLYANYRPKADMVRIMDRLAFIVQAARNLPARFMSDHDALRRMVHFATSLRAMRILNAGNNTGIPRIEFPSPSEVALAVQWVVEVLMDSETSSQAIGQPPSETEATVTGSGPMEVEPEVELEADPEVKLEASVDISTAAAKAVSEALSTTPPILPYCLPKFTETANADARCDAVLHMARMERTIFNKCIALAKGGTFNANTTGAMNFLLQHHWSTVCDLHAMSHTAVPGEGALQQEDGATEQVELEIRTFYKKHRGLLLRAGEALQHGFHVSYNAPLAAGHASILGSHHHHVLQRIYQRLNAAQKRTLAPYSLARARCEVGLLPCRDGDFGREERDSGLGQTQANADHFAQNQDALRMYIVREGLDQIDH